MNKPTNNYWNEIKKQYRMGLFFSLIIIFAFLVYPGYKGKNIENDLITEVKILAKKPAFEKISRGKSGSKYFVELQFVKNIEKYKIEGVDYPFLKNEDFVNEVKSGDTISISRNIKSIYYLSKNGKQYLNHKKAELNRENTNYFFGLLFIPMALISIFALILREQPTIKLKEKIYIVQLDVITIIIFIITFIILAENIPFTFIINGEFVK